MEQSYYIIIPPVIRGDKTISPASKLLYGEISVKCNSTGFCWAKNDFFADIFGCETRSIQRYIKELEQSGYIKIEFSINNLGTDRKIFITIKGGDIKDTPGMTDLSPVTKKAVRGDKKDIPPVTKQSLGGDKKVTHINNKRDKPKENTKKDNISPLIASGGQKEVFNEFKNVFNDFYKQKFFTDYDFSAKDGQKIYSVVRKILRKFIENNPDSEKFTIKALSNGYVKILEAAYSDNWMQSNFSHTIIDSKFNEIYILLKNGPNTKKGNGGAGSVPATNHGVIDAINKRFN